MSENVTEEDRRATQRFATMHVLIPFVGRYVNADLVEEMLEALVKEMTDSPCSWAFKK